MFVKYLYSQSNLMRKLPNYVHWDNITFVVSFIFQLHIIYVDIFEASHIQRRAVHASVGTRGLLDMSTLYVSTCGTICLQIYIFCPLLCCLFTSLLYNNYGWLLLSLGRRPLIEKSRSLYTFQSSLKVQSYTIFDNFCYWFLPCKTWFILCRNVSDLICRSHYPV